MALLDVSWENELQEQFSLLSATSVEVENKCETHITQLCGTTDTYLIHLCDEVLILILRELDPMSLLRIGTTCRSLFRVSSCNSLWTKHFQASFKVTLPTATCSISAKNAFCLLFMWRALFRNLHCNRSLQEKLFAEIPNPPQKYWIQWLVLEENVPLPSVRLPSIEIESLWGVDRDVLETKVKEKSDEGDIVRFEWKELYNLAVAHHGSVELVFQHILNQHSRNDHSELESLYRQYVQCRFQWLFTYWLFRQPPPFNRQLRSIYLQWRQHSTRKVSTWGETLCDVRYLASLHSITSDYWRGKLAGGDETLGIQTVENYFSMCKSLVAWILGRDWGRLKRKKVYEDTLAGVYLLLRREMREALVEHERFWHVAKMQMSRVCVLEETAANYVNWKMIETLPYYKLYLVSGNTIYLDHVKGFLRRKRLIHNWLYLEENIWARQLLPDQLFYLLEFDTKITQDSLHGDATPAQLGRLIWLYLHSGHQLYLEAVKGMVLECAHTSLGFYQYQAQHHAHGHAHQRCASNGGR
ncbi:hypothetical protein AALO_G00112780 [Alosa alosa]|uniref:F-box domain-containing protein n=1 Tax=Alosa alosa TaxID=278164 RepID=A0AAV6GT59_9TELE|nr:uncharacterized protein si:dkeyp-114g9.1 [Alosa alosa]KAG5277036.1 hypothetical protein AALO_G00112780 [Alosa alosa]